MMTTMMILWYYVRIETIYIYYSLAFLSRIIESINHQGRRWWWWYIDITITYIQYILFKFTTACSLSFFEQIKKTGWRSDWPKFQALSVDNIETCMMGLGMSWNMRGLHYTLIGIYFYHTTVTRFMRCVSNFVLKPLVIKHGTYFVDIPKICRMTCNALLQNTTVIYTTQYYDSLRWNARYVTQIP